MTSKVIKSLSFDAKKKEKAKSKNKFKASANAEREFYKALRRVAKVSGHIVDAHTEGASIKDIRTMMDNLENYSKLIEPWAKRQSEKLLAQVNRSNKVAYRNQGQKIESGLTAMKESANVGRVAMALLNEQVALIKSIPLEAGLRAQEIASENFIQGRRAIPDKQVISQLEEEMGMSTEVAINRARLIARTETARANASFVQARAAAVGAKGYIWRTTMDGAERKSHADMNGEFVEYDHPPILTDGTSGHAGTFPNCRCYQDPVLPDYEE